MYDKTQLMRGSLEGCILKIIEQQTTYGYEILMNMREAGWMDVTEGTLYPILLRLEKLQYIRAEKRDSPHRNLQSQASYKTPFVDGI